MTADSYYTAFIDLLGTKESANVHAGTFKEAIDRFTEVVTSSALQLDDSAHVRLFSDCAFISFKNFKTFTDYITNVRYELFGENYFFKCAVVPGRLNASEWKPRPSQARDKALLQKRVTGTTFSASSVDAYVLHERFKGVGVAIDDDMGYPDLTVQTVYFKGDDGRNIITTYDIKYSAKETGFLCESDEEFDDEGADRNQESEVYIRAILSSIVSAKTKQRTYGKYYISTLISLIKSSDFSQINCDNSGRWTHYPIMFRHLFVNNFVEQKLRDILGWEFCYLAAVGSFFSQQRPTRPSDTQRALIYEIARRPKVTKKISQAPACIIDVARREELLRGIAALTTEGLAQR